MKVKFVDKQFRKSSLELIELMNNVINSYNAQGYSLTLRQLYYQLVARDLISNNEKSYNKIGNLVSDGRLAGLIDWNGIVDRTRRLTSLNHYENPQEIIELASNWYRNDMWENQDYYVEVWVEKEALSDIVGQASERFDVPYFSCRGYVSQSAMYKASLRFRDKQMVGKHCILIYLGDHDPSGIDMGRDIQERLDVFQVHDDMFDFNRIALSMEQIKEFNPPPNPAKLTDSRANGYIEKYGYNSWELDALEPRVITGLITTEIEKYLDKERYNEILEKVAEEKSVMLNITNDWEDIYENYK